jgi:transcriptional regulator with GAF, ATPase, and Fis domain
VVDASRRADALPPRIQYERYAGAASAPLAASYRRREPEKTVLHAVVRDHLETFLADKGGSLTEIRVPLGRALEGRQLQRENRRLARENQLLRNQVQGRYNPQQIVGQSPRMRALFDKIVLCANTNHTVLIRGESGTGKELVARAIHYSSLRCERALFTIDCTSLSHSLIECELFGHRHGSFTGASEDRKGIFEEANGSTLFLNEIGDMPLETQPKLLRASEQKEFKRIGENVPHTSDVRIVAATNQNLLALVEEGRFREGLYARLEVITLVLPPLGSARRTSRCWSSTSSPSCTRKAGGRARGSSRRRSRSS